MIESLAHGYSSDSTQRELSNEYQHAKVKMVFKNLCVPVLWTKVASVLGGLNPLEVAAAKSSMKKISNIFCAKGYLKENEEI